MTITKSAAETSELGKKTARELKNTYIVCLVGELGSGKTTFTQGFLEELGAEGPYTSPTFLIIKHYEKEFPISNFQFLNKSKNPKSQTQNIYHIDTYRVGIKDILNLGWEEIIANRRNIILVEWADRIKEIIPNGAVWINFKWLSEKEREINFLNK
jgi:tRNA threonylcarbamoyladenosine biosynthesis protein TsaE